MANVMDTLRARGFVKQTVYEEELYEKLGKEKVTIILNGGIFRNYPEYAAAVIAASPKDVHFICSDLPPIYGSAVEAMYDIGQISLPDTFKSNFMGSYGK